MGTGRPPSPWSMLMAELMVSEFTRSLAFWTGPLGFTLPFQPPSQNFACLQRPARPHLTIYQRDGDWEVAPMEPPFGRGAVIQIYVEDVTAVHTALRQAGITPYVDLRERWRDWGDRLGGQREFLVQDPDGYLVMVVQRIGERPLP